MKFIKRLLLLSSVFLLFACSRKTTKSPVSSTVKPTTQDSSKTTTENSNSKAKKMVSLSLSKNIDEAGSVEGSGSYEENSLVKIKATANATYEFKGWYKGEELISTLRSIKIINETKIIYKTDKFILSSRLQDGVYPPYNQLIPQNCEKVAVVKRQNLCDALERVANVVDGRTSTVKFNFKDNVLTLTADTPNEGKGEEILEVDYTSEELNIAFNYKYVLESIKMMEEEKVRIWLSSSLSATVFLPDEQDNYLCLIMPMEMRV